MRVHGLRLGVVLGGAVLLVALAYGGDGMFVRGDTNRDGAIDIADPIHTLRYLFVPGTTVECLDALDANDSGQVDIADAVFELLFLFRQGSVPPPPFEHRDFDTTSDALTCGEGGAAEGWTLSYAPRQCEPDAWQTAPGKDVAERVAAWIEGLGGEVIEARVEDWPVMVCMACGCPSGYSIIVVVRGDAAIEQLLAYGFQAIVV